MSYKVSIIGAGNVGASLAYELAQRDLCTHLSLVDIYEDLACGKAMDIAHSCIANDNFYYIQASKDFTCISNSDIVVVTAGLPRKEGQSREDLLLKNASITKDIAKNIAKYAPNAIIIQVSNPLDAMVYVALKESGFDKSKVLGMAGVLDSSRMSYHILNELDFVPKKIKSLVIGMHGDEMLPLLKFCSVDNKPLLDILHVEQCESVVQKTKKGGAEIVSLLKTSAYYAPAFCILKMIKAIKEDTKQTLPCSVYLDGEYGYKNVTCGVPVVLGKNGVERIKELDLDEKEKKEFDKSVKSIKELLSILKDNKF